MFSRIFSALAIIALIFLPFSCMSNQNTNFKGLASLSPVVKMTLPSVVKIDVVETIDKNSPQNNGAAPFFEFFFDNPDQQENKSFKNESLGSGVIIRKDGQKYYVISNAHVVGTAQSMRITLDDGTEFTAQLKGKDTKRDLALLEFESPRDIPIIPLSNSDLLEVGDWVLAIGTPYGFQSTVTLGIVSALNRRGGPGDTVTDFIQTDAAINKGNSGGALLDLEGRLVGINTWISSQGGGSIGLAFAVPSKQVSKVVNDFLTYGAISTPWLGVHMFTLDKELIKELGLSISKGVIVVGVYRNSPAWKIGLRPGDIILSIDNKSMGSSDILIQNIADRSVGEKVTVSSDRFGEKSSYQLELIPRAEDSVIASYARYLWPGFAVYPLGEQLRQELNIGSELQGMVVRQVVNGSDAEKAGLLFGDIVTHINDSPVTNSKSFYDLVAAALVQKNINLRILKSGKEQTISFDLFE